MMTSSGTARTVGETQKTGSLIRYLLIGFVAVVVVYIALFHSFYFMLYPLSSVDPYLYYSYSPGFWSVDISFWIFTPLYYMWFRHAGEGRAISLVYSLSLDASAVGIFLVFFCLVYGIDPFASAYYTYAFVLALLFFVPVLDMKFSRKNMLLFLAFPVAGVIWKFTGTGNVGYFLSTSVVIDLFMIFYCFLFIFFFRKVGKVIHA